MSERARFLELADGSVWPDPDATADLEHALRYSPHVLSRGDELVLASICAAYRELALRPAFRRKPIMLRAARQQSEERKP